MPELSEKVEKIKLKENIKESIKDTTKPKKDDELTPSQEIAHLNQMQQVQIFKYKENLVKEVTNDARSHKLQTQVHQELVEEEHFWLNYEFEETQIKVDLAQFVFDTLI
mmetsp:Transcript_41473/g.63285  ORF Transcript_41473/g.63285 Transcript_41473/m.63285 type:complete len:109 (+) Transcript_41473:4385-4711(+)